MIRRKDFGTLPYNRKEILRYAGVRGQLPEVDELMESCLREVQNRLTLRVCWGEFPVKICGDELDFSFARVVSADLKKMMKDCSRIVVFGATVGIEMDRLVSRYSRLSPSRALMFQAIGAERIESLCDFFQKEIEKEQKNQGFEITPRFSPGYGDLSLEFQKELFRVLDCSRMIGLSLNGSLMMTPTKSVTAMIGIRRATEESRDKQV